MGNSLTQVVSLDARRGKQEESPLLSRLACPVCSADGSLLVTSAESLTCECCSSQFPTFSCGRAEIPWLFSQPDVARLEWKARFNGFKKANTVELEQLLRALQTKSASEPGRRRLVNQLYAVERYREQVVEILGPIDLEGIDWPADATKLLHGKLPGNQGLSSYTSNIFRDWAWNNGENKVLLDAIDLVLTADKRRCLGSLLTLGAGAGRLSYDMHRRYRPNLSVVSDFNPFLLQIASLVIQGEPVSLYEFPVAPLNQSSFSVLQECCAPTPLGDENLYYVLADASNPPFAKASFDTVVTPWLIDIIPQDLKTFIPRLNRLLPRGGMWINTGSLAFFHSDQSWCYSEEEVLDLVTENGFEILSAQRQTIDYLQSPHSAHGRRERILSFSAMKIWETDLEEAHVYVPEWILDISRSVPVSSEHRINASGHMLKAQILAAIDGKRTIEQIGQRLAAQHGLGKLESIHAVKRILLDAWEERQFKGENWPM